MNLVTKKIIPILIVCALIGVSLFLVSIPSDQLIGFVGAENVYVFMFVIALVGSISTFASIPYPLILLGLAAGGINPLFIGLASACGVIASDTITFFTVRRSRELVSEKLLASMELIGSYIDKYPRLLVPGLTLYGTLSPLSNDFAVISLSLMRYAYHKVVLPLAVGNVVYNVSIAFLGAYAYDWIVGLF